MMGFDPGLELGQEITNQQLTKLFNCGNSGGMRKVNKYNILVLITDRTKKFYKDEWRGEILLYTGMGKKGNQELFRKQNITLKESNENGVELHLFEVFKKNEYTYRGNAQLIDDPYQEEQDGRIVWIFPIKLNKKRIDASQDLNRNKINIEIDNLMIDEELNIGRFGIRNFKEYSKKPRKKKKPKLVNGYNVFNRDKRIALNALAFSGYKCEIDNQHFTFIRKNANVAYTEPHHLVPMEFSDQFDHSLDVEENIVSLCSNCHNEIHYGRDRFVLLGKLYAERVELLKAVNIIITFEELKQMYK